MNVGVQRAVDLLLQKVATVGVPWIPIGDLGELFGGLTGKTKQDFTGGNARFVTYMNVFRNSATDMDAPDFVKVEPGERQRALRAGDVIFTGSSENASEVGVSSAVVEDPPEPTYLNSFCFALRPNPDIELDPAFSKHLFRSTAMRLQIQRTASGVTRFNVSKERFRKVVVPVPPMEVQREIVQILDTFTELDAELDAELEARRRQYAYYASVLVNDSQRGESVALQELCRSGVVTMGRGKVISKEDLVDDPGDYPVYSSSGAGEGVFGRYAQFMFDDERITWSIDGGGRIFHREASRYSVTNVCGWLKVNSSELLTRYLYYVLHDQWLSEKFDYSRKAHPSVIKDVYRVTIPPLSVQESVVKTLDSFSALVDGVTGALPAEIAARRKQYEYYRDRLFDFERLAV